MDEKMLRSGDVLPEYEHVFHVIDTLVSHPTDQQMLKLFTLGYTVDDVALTMDSSRTEVRKRLSGIRSSHPELKSALLQ